MKQLLIPKTWVSAAMQAHCEDVRSRWTPYKEQQSFKMPRTSWWRRAIGQMRAWVRKAQMEIEA